MTEMNFMENKELREQMVFGLLLRLWVLNGTSLWRKSMERRTHERTANF